MSDIRIVKTKRNIRQAFFNLLRQTTYSNVTVDMLCKEALCSRSTFYVHYSGKDDLLKEIVTVYVEKFRIHFKNRLSHYDSNNFFKIINVVNTHFIIPNQSELTLLFESEEIDNYFSKQLEAIFNAAYLTHYHVTNQQTILPTLYAINATTILKSLIKNRVSDTDLLLISQLQESILTTLPH